MWLFCEARKDDSRRQGMGFGKIIKLRGECCHCELIGSRVDVIRLRDKGEVELKEGVQG